MSSEGIAVDSLAVLDASPVVVAATPMVASAVDASTAAAEEVDATDAAATVVVVAEKAAGAPLPTPLAATGGAAGKATSDSEDLSENVPESDSGAVTTPPYETADFNKTANSSSHHDSEYDTASDTPSSDNELHDDDGDDDDDDDDDFEDDDDEADEDVELDLERQSGDGEEQEGEKKKVDDDEDRSNPQYIPKRGVFYEHDDRTADEPESAPKGEGEELNDDDKQPDEVAPVAKRPVKKSADRWSHDRFNANDQAPKSRSELVNSYGYDIRNEDGPPRAHRRRRYAGGPNKYTRKWEDESAYNKVSSSQQQQRNPRPEEFPELGNRKGPRNGAVTVAREEKENSATTDDAPQQQFRSSTQQLRNEKPAMAEETNAQRDAANDKHRQISSSNERFDKQPQRFDNDKRSNDSFDNNRQGGDRFENRDRPSPRQDRFVSARNNDGFERQQNDRFDNGPRGAQRNDRDRPPNNDRPFARNSSGVAPSSGFRTGKNTMEFKNQTRSTKSGDGPLVPAQQQQLQPTNAKLINNAQGFNASRQHQTPTNTKLTNAGGFNTARQQQYEYEEDVRVDAHKYANTKLIPMATQNQDSIGAAEFEPTDRMPGERAITGRQHAPSVNKRIQNTLLPNSGPLPLTNPSLLGNAPLPSMHQQSQPAAPQIQMPTEASRPKRYSTLRQRSALDPSGVNQLPQHVQSNPMAMHDQQQQQQQLMMQDNAMLMQRQQQQLQEQIQLQPPNANYMQQSLPTQQHQQQMLIGSQQQPQNVQPSAAQYQAAAYYAAQPPPPSQNDFPVASVVNQQQQTTQPQSNQYSSQYGVGPPSNPAYMSAAPPPPNAYLPQQQQQPPVVAVVTGGQQQSAAVNYGPAVTGAGGPPQFAPVATFPAYPPVANYNSVSSGITYYAPQTQPPPRPILPQRRPTNAIPILAPPERANFKNRMGAGRSASNATGDDNDDDSAKMAGAATIGSPENIDHILDNMFVQRAPYQPPTVSAAAPSGLLSGKSMEADALVGAELTAGELNIGGISKMSINDLKTDDHADSHLMPTNVGVHESVANAS